MNTDKFTWQEVELFFSGDAYFTSLVKAIVNAKQKIYLESYIFAVDHIGHYVLEALKQASNRGVKVHLLVDGVGSFEWIDQISTSLKGSHVNFRIYHPLPIGIKFFNPFWYKTTLDLVGKVNKRNHRKVTVIDDQIAYLGSMNISEVHSESIFAELAWRDTSLRIVGKEVHWLGVAFTKAWRASHRFNFKISKRFKLSLSRFAKGHASKILFNYSLPTRMKATRTLQKKLDSAQRRIWITNAYFVPPRKLIRSLKKAAGRGVDVRLCLPAISDVPIARWASSAFYGSLLKSKVKILEYQNHMLHAKTLLID